MPNTFGSNSFGQNTYLGNTFSAAGVGGPGGDLRTFLCRAYNPRNFRCLLFGPRTVTDPVVPPVTPTVPTVIRRRRCPTVATLLYNDTPVADRLGTVRPTLLPGSQAPRKIVCTAPTFDRRRATIPVYIPDPVVVVVTGTLSTFLPNHYGSNSFRSSTFR